MLKIKIFTCFLLFFVVLGCNKTNATIKEYVVLTDDHKTLTYETCDSVIKSIEDEIVLLKAANDFTPEKEKDLTDLTLRLQYMKKQSDLIYRYSFVEYADKALISEIIKAKWKQNQEVK